MYFNITNGNQSELIIKPDKDSEWIDEIIQEYPWDEYDEYENRLNEYMEHLFDSLSGKTEGINDEYEFWNALTLGQKCFYSFLAFEGEVDNGGLFQFFWNKPEHAYSFKDVIDILGLTQLKEDYLDGLSRYEKVAEELEKLKEKIIPDDNGWEEKYYYLYEEGLALFGEENNMEEYFYDVEFKKIYHQAMCNYIENNRSEFVEV